MNILNYISADAENDNCTLRPFSAWTFNRLIKKGHKRAKRYVDEAEKQRNDFNHVMVPTSWIRRMQDHVDWQEGSLRTINMEEEDSTDDESGPADTSSSTA